MMKKEKDIHIKVTLEKYQILKDLAREEYRKITAIVDRALDNYLKLRKKMK